MTDTTPLPARLIDSPLALARAELRLVLVHTRELTMRAVTAFLATIFVAAFAQTTLLLLVRSPFLAEAIVIETLVGAIVLSRGVAFPAAIGAVLSWTNMPRSVTVNSREVSLSAGERAAGVPGVPEPARPAHFPEPQHQLTTSVTLAERMS